MISKGKIIKYLQGMDKIATKFLESSSKEEKDKIYNEFIKYLETKEIIRNLDSIDKTYPGFFVYAEKLRIAMEENYTEVLIAILQTKNINMVNFLISKYYQADIDSKKFTKEVIDNFSEKEFFNYLDKLYFLRDFYELYEKKEELDKINILFNQFNSNKKYGKRYVLDDFLEENYPELYALVLSIRKDTEGANKYSIETLKKLKKTSKINELKLIEKDIEFLKKNKNYFILFSTSFEDESLFRMFCQEYIDRTGILEENITWFNEVLSKGYAVLSIY